MLTPVAKFLTISLVVNLFAHSLGSLHHIQDDIFTLPRYKVVLTNEKISNSQVQAKEVEVKLEKTARDIRNILNI